MTHITGRFSSVIVIKHQMHASPEQQHLTDSYAISYMVHPLLVTTPNKKIKRFFIIQVLNS
jgi:hypothetical protein